MKFNMFEQFNNMAQMQKDMYEAWQKGMQKQNNPFDYWSKFAGNKNAFAMPEFWDYDYNKFMPDFKFGEQSFAGFDFSDWYEKLAEISKENFDKAAQNPFDVYNKMLDSGKAMQSAFKLWKEINKEFLEPGAKKAKNEFKKWIANSEDYIDTTILPHLPGGFKDHYKNLNSTRRSFQELVISLLGPWTDLAVDLDKYIVEDEEGTEYIDLVAAWKDNYKKTFGKILDTPALGSSREYIDKMNDSVDSYIELMTITGRFSQTLLRHAGETTERVIEHMVELQKKGAEPKSFKEFYDFWTSELDKQYENAFLTKEFSKLIGSVSDAAMKYKIDSDSVLEGYLKTLPVPTRSEMDTVYKTIYDLKKEVRTLKRKVKELETQGTDAKTAPKTAAKKATKAATKTAPKTK